MPAFASLLDLHISGDFFPVQGCKLAEELLGSKIFHICNLALNGTVME